MTALLEVDDPVRGRLVVPDLGRTVLLGPSGSGKTAWFRSLLGPAAPSASGAVRLDGIEVDADTLRRHVGWVPQVHASFLSATVWDNVARPVAGVRVDGRAAEEALDLLGLLDRASDTAESLSRGHPRRLDLAPALARRPDLLVVDSSLDPAVTALWEGLMAQLPHPWPRGVLTATAVADAPARRHDTVAVLEAGRVIACGRWAEIAESRAPGVRAVMAWVTPA